jgi:hypothetical protein
MRGWAIAIFVAGCGGGSSGSPDMTACADLDCGAILDFSTEANDAAPDLSTQNDLLSIDQLTPLDLTPPADLTPVACPLRPVGEWHVSPTGSDTQTVYAGNGSSACPTKTIGRAIALAYADTLNATIYVHKGGTSPTIYGDNCTGGPPCDGAVGLVPASGQTLALQGDDAASVVIASSKSSVLNVSCPGTTTVKNLSVQPLMLGVTGSSSQGIGVYLTGGGLCIVQDVSIQGVTPSSTTPGSASGIVVLNNTQAQLGPGLKIVGGATGVSWGGTPAFPAITLTGTVTDPSIIEGSGACITGFRTITGTGSVTLMNCAQNGILGGASSGDAISGIVVTGGGDGTGAGIVWSGTMQQVQVSNFVGKGIDCLDCTMTGTVQVTKTVGPGVRVMGSGGGSISGLTSTMNQGDGLRCDSSPTLTISNSILSGNQGNGLFVSTACSPNVHFGANDEFNRTSAKNGLSGICAPRESRSSQPTSSGSARLFSVSERTRDRAPSRCRRWFGDRPWRGARAAAGKGRATHAALAACADPASTLALA